MMNDYYKKKGAEAQEKYREYIGKARHLTELANISSDLKFKEVYEFEARWLYEQAREWQNKARLYNNMISSKGA